MVFIAASLYLPGHVAIMSRRAYWYALGDTDGRNASLQKVAPYIAGETEESIHSVATAVAQATNTALRAAAQAMSEVSQSASAKIEL